MNEERVSQFAKGQSSSAGQAAPPAVVSVWWYGRVSGTPKASGESQGQSDAYSVVAFAVEPLVSMNELTLHLLEVSRARVRAKCGLGGNAGFAADLVSFPPSLLSSLLHLLTN